MNNRALLIDAFSTVHVGNGALIDNTYKLVAANFKGEVDVLTIDTKPNVGRFDRVYEDIFSDYSGGKWNKLKVALLVLLVFLVEAPNSYLFKGRIRFPWGGRLRKQLDVINSSSLCVSLSGETINDHYYPHMYLRLLIYWLPILQGKRFVLFPQSIGPVFKPLSKFLLRLCLGKAEYAIARDKKSYETACELWKNCPIKVEFCPDVAVTQNSEAQDFTVSKTDRPLVGLTVSDIPRAEMGFNGDYLNAIVSAVAASVDKERFEIVLMPSNYVHGRMSNDYKFCLAAKESLEQRGYVASILENRIYHPDEYQGLQRKLYAFITTRMHVGILGTSAAVPTVMINTQHKIRAYMELMGRGDCVVELNRLQDDLPKCIEFVLKNNEGLRFELKKKNAELRNQVESVLARIVKEDVSDVRR